MAGTVVTGYTQPRRGSNPSGPGADFNFVRSRRYNEMTPRATGPGRPHRHRISLKNNDWADRFWINTLTKLS